METVFYDVELPFFDHDLDKSCDLRKGPVNVDLNRLSSFSKLNIRFEYPQSDFVAQGFLSSFASFSLFDPQALHVPSGCSTNVSHSESILNRKHWVYKVSESEEVYVPVLVRAPVMEFPHLSMETLRTMYSEHRRNLLTKDTYLLEMIPLLGKKIAYLIHISVPHDSRLDFGILWCDDIMFRVEGVSCPAIFCQSDEDAALLTPVDPHVKGLNYKVVQWMNISDNNLKFCTSEYGRTDILVKLGGILYIVDSTNNSDTMTAELYQSEFVQTRERLVRGVMTDVFDACLRPVSVECLRVFVCAIEKCANHLCLPDMMHVLAKVKALRCEFTMSALDAMRECLVDSNDDIYLAYGLFCTRFITYGDRSSRKYESERLNLVVGRKFLLTSCPFVKDGLKSELVFVNKRYLPSGVASSLSPALIKDGSVVFYQYRIA